MPMSFFNPHMRPLLELKQTRTVVEYTGKFWERLHRVLALYPNLGIECFVQHYVEGLREDIQAVVRSRSPSSITGASCLARIREDEIVEEMVMGADKLSVRSGFTPRAILPDVFAELAATVQCRAGPDITTIDGSSHGARTPIMCSIECPSSNATVGVFSKLDVLTESDEDLDTVSTAPLTPATCSTGVRAHTREGNDIFPATVGCIIMAPTRCSALCLHDNNDKHITTQALLSKRPRCREFLYVNGNLKPVASCWKSSGPELPGNDWFLGYSGTNLVVQKKWDPGIVQRPFLNDVKLHGTYEVKFLWVLSRRRYAPYITDITCGSKYSSFENDASIGIKHEAEYETMLNFFTVSVWCFSREPTHSVSLSLPWEQLVFHKISSVCKTTYTAAYQWDPRILVGILHVPNLPCCQRGCMFSLTTPNTYIYCLKGLVLASDELFNELGYGSSKCFFPEVPWVVPNCLCTSLQTDRNQCKCDWKRRCLLFAILVGTVKYLNEFVVKLRTNRKLMANNFEVVDLLSRVQDIHLLLKSWPYYVLHLVEPCSFCLSAQKFVAMGRLVSEGRHQDTHMDPMSTVMLPTVSTRYHCSVELKQQLRSGVINTTLSSGALNFSRNICEGHMETCYFAANYRICLQVVSNVASKTQTLVLTSDIADLVVDPKYGMLHYSLHQKCSCISKDGQMAEKDTKFTSSASTQQRQSSVTRWPWDPGGSCHYPAWGQAGF